MHLILPLMVQISQYATESILRLFAYSYVVTMYVTGEYGDWYCTERWYVAPATKCSCSLSAQHSSDSVYSAAIDMSIK
jgi:hypothetical protein